MSEKFRRQLRQEAEKWWKAGWIDAAFYEQLAEQYQFRRLEQDASHRFIAILMGLGSILLGLGALTFVAANWQVWSRPVKVVLLLGLFIGVNAAGFYLWRRPVALKGQQRLGQGLLLLGGLLLGANLSLMSQMFHQSGNLYELFLVWGLGVIAMSYSLRLTPLGILSWILIEIGYWSGWLSHLSDQDLSFWSLLIQHMPIVAALLFIPLAYWCRSRALFGLGSVTLASALAFNALSAWDSMFLSVGWSAAVAFVLPAALLWSYHSRIWRSAQTVDPFQPVARSLALGCLSVGLFVLSFRGWWESNPTPSSSVHWQPLVDIVLLTAVAGLGWLQIRQDWRRNRPQEYVVNHGTVAALLLITAVSLIWNFDVFPLSIIAVLLFNLLLLLLAIGLIRDGLGSGNRGMFWGGMVLLVLSIISRMLEYDTGLLLKSIVFALCGAGIIAAGLWFERHAKPTQPHALPSTPST